MEEENSSSPGMCTAAIHHCWLLKQECNNQKQVAVAKESFHVCTVFQDMLYFLSITWPPEVFRPTEIITTSLIALTKCCGFIIIIFNL